MSLLKLKYQKYKNPNKFLIKNNKFIRNFDKLYKNIKDPWNQKKTLNLVNNLFFVFRVY